MIFLTLEDYDALEDYMTNNKEGCPMDRERVLDICFDMPPELEPLLMQYLVSEEDLKNITWQGCDEIFDIIKNDIAIVTEEMV